MLRFIATTLMLALLGGVAVADRDRRGDRNDRNHDRRPVVRDHRNNHPPRVNRPARRSDRRVVDRRPVHANNGRYVFAGGVSRAYTRPVIHRHYYNYRVRPQIIVERYDPVPGYVWIRGQWSWNGREWRWGDGHFAPDPQYSNYYDDGSYDYSVNIRLGG